MAGPLRGGGGDFFFAASLTISSTKYYFTFSTCKSISHLSKAKKKFQSNKKILKKNQGQKKNFGFPYNVHI